MAFLSPIYRYISDNLCLFPYLLINVMISQVEISIGKVMDLEASLSTQGVTSEQDSAFVAHLKQERSGNVKKIQDFECEVLKMTIENQNLTDEWVIIDMRLVFVCLPFHIVFVMYHLFLPPQFLTTTVIFLLILFTSFVKNIEWKHFHLHVLICQPFN